jgi:hypothetical protein
VTFELLVFVAGAFLILDARTSHVLVAYVVLVGTVGWFASPAAQDAPFAFALFALSLFLKLIVTPAGIWLFAHRNAAARSLRPGVSLPLRLIVVLALGFGSQAVSNVPGLAQIPAIGVVAYIILCGLAVLVIHHNLLAQVIGLLVLGTGVTLAGIVCAPELPAVLELGATFDALVVTFIGLMLVRATLTHNPLLEVDSLRSLRG